MKFLKPVLLTTILFAAAASTVVYTSCEKSRCTGVTCAHGGSCNDGQCKCPTGYEGPTCETRIIDRYLGYYAGFSSCNNGAEIIDTVFVYQDDPKNNLSVKVIEKVHPTDVLHGYVSSNETTYQMTLNDIVRTNYTKSFHVTLQSDKTLTLYSYEHDDTNPLDTIQNSCSFFGTKH